MYLLTAMSMERRLSRLFPIWYWCRCPKHLSGIICGVLWALTGLFISLKFYVAVLLSVIFLSIFGLRRLSVVIFLGRIGISLFVLQMTYLLASLNSSINLVIYFPVGSCRQRWFQSSAKVTLSQEFKEKATSEEESHIRRDTAVETTL
ncbi:LOW QUALITY PROTEIN: proto-oncogene Mas-like [Aquila chrysaetos chrysaetos]|uniref:LOW QUALITY PROTEIN: proto-oncogene Mas-like n=1 Tax=Aquila chrysaetos chrysaetos TaxID=223781 RepID=UPI001B7D322F|nr:LOW QUALITY PROTEIN: proto-oncogene Mas-like [Aquila chrysaetos chrysaetos]